MLLSPLAVVKRPIRWLQGISHYRATISGGPNFSYDMCVQRIHAEDCEDLDLSSWEVAFNGAESIRADTMEAFSERFTQHGFRSSAFLPVYGLAEFDSNGHLSTEVGAAEDPALRGHSTARKPCRSQ